MLILSYGLNRRGCGMISQADKSVRCPLCGGNLSNASNFTLAGRANANVYLCYTCNELILSWRLFIQYRKHLHKDPIVIPTNDRLHKDFIEEARLRNKTGDFPFDEEVLFVLTDKEFTLLKKSHGDIGIGSSWLVAEAYLKAQHKRILN
jgi:hypothetical protein